MKLMKTLAIVAGLAAGSCAYAAGNIYEIVPCLEDGTAIASPVATAENPLKPETTRTIYFKVRMWRTQAMSTAGDNWALKPVGNVTEIEEIINRLLTPLSLGIYVSGKLEYAKYVGYSDLGGGSDVRDFIFSYTLKAGDFALPIRLAGNDGKPVGYGESSSEYMLLNADKWEISNPSGVKATFQYDNPDWPGNFTPSYTTGRQLDYTLSMAGFHVQTIDFDPEWESADFWRIVNAKGVTTQSLPPRLYADAAPEDAVVMHVWSMNDDIVKIEGGREVNDFVIGYDSGTPITKKTTVGDISFGLDKVYANFTLKGGDTAFVGQWTNLVLSAYDGYTFWTGSGDLVRDFITVPVSLTNALPPTVKTTLSIISGVNNTIYANSDYLKPVATVTLSVTEAPASAFTVTLKPTFSGDPSAENWWDYVYFADVTELGDDGALSEFSESTKTHTAPTVEFSPTVTSKTLYLVALRSDDRTNRAGHQMKFTPEWTTHPYTELNPQSAACYIQAFPAVGSMEKGTSSDSPLSVICNDPLQLKIKVSDTYADVTSTNGYTLTVSLDASGALVDPDPITNLVVGAGGYLYVANEDGTPSSKLPTVSYGLSSAGSDPDYFTSSYTLTSPESGLTSDSAKFYVKVVEKTKYRVAITNEGTGEEYTSGTPAFNEDDEITFTVTLNSPNMLGQTIYAYLEFKNKDDLDEAAIFEADDEEFIIGMANLEGIPIGQSETVAEGTVRLLDNAPTRRLQISKVYFSFDSSLDPNDMKNLVSYDYDTANSVTRFTIDNVEPLLSKIKVGTTSLDPGTIYTTKIPLNSERRFSAVVKDVAADLNATNTPAKDYRFETLWTTWCYQIGDGESVDDYTDDQIPGLQFEQMDLNGEGVTKRGNPNDMSFTNTFEVAGIWKVSCQLRDKDTDELSGEYSLYLKVTDAGVSVSQLDNFDETDRSQQLSVSLNYWDSQFAGTVFVALKVKSNAADSTNPGRLKFNDALLWTNVWTTVDPFELSDSGTVTNAADAAADYYLLSFSSRSQLTQKLSILDADGVNDSFTYNAYVVSARTSAGVEKILPASGKLAASYYAPSEVCQVTLFNVDPIREYIRVSPDPEKNTNVWTSAKTIVWTVPYNADVAGDFAAVDGLVVSITGDGVINNFTTNIHGMASGAFTPDLGNASGAGEIVMTVTDKDGGYQEWVWRYDLPPAKSLVTTPNGPTGIGNSGISQKYVNADGRGRGHMYVVGANAMSANSFNITWTCTGRTEVPVYAYGYKVGTADNGHLDNGNDQALTENGAKAAKAATADITTGYYLYKGQYGGYEGLYDSFLYAWIISVPTTDTGSTEWNVTFAPESLAEAAVPANAQLPSDTTGDKHDYVPVKVEAAFAREWLPADNLGDINLDGVPDIFATKYWRDNANLIGRSFESDNDNGVNDMVDLAAYNPDKDKVPGVYSQSGTLGNVSGYNNSYAPVGIDLATRMEIRGFDLGLNDWLVTKSDISFSDDELFAWTNLITSAEGIEKGYATTNEQGEVISAIAPDLVIWTPEPGTALYPRMDPTLEDTDEDNYPDGWEYFFWYQAKVWVPAFAWRDAHPNDLDSNGNKLIDPESKKNRLYPGQPRAGQFFPFERFTLDNIVKGVEIPASEVMKRFDPCTPYNAEEYAEKPLRYDFDNDGLSDLEELVLGTNPCHWDTDGDRLCDAWEVMMCLDPIHGSKNDNPDGDFMAYYAVRHAMCWIDPDAAVTDPTAEGVRIYVMPNLQNGLDYTFNTDTLKYEMLRTVEVTDAFSFTPKFEGPDGSRTRVVYGLREDIPNTIPVTWICGGYMVDRVVADPITLKVGTEILSGRELEIGEKIGYVLVHDQVRDAFGFDPRTGWNMNVNGFVSDRWDPAHNGKNVNLFSTTGKAVNTRPYSNYDEYLVMKYRLGYNIDYSPMTDSDNGYNANNETMWSFIRRKTTNPNVVYPAKTSDDGSEGDATASASTDEEETAAAKIAKAVAEAFNQAGSDKSPVTTHGADTDLDAVPDGWELYMYRNPNVGPIADDENPEIPNVDHDDDELSWAEEYAGVDSCDAYMGCESIFKNHPGKTKGWWNKFFPTNPGTMKYGSKTADDGRILYAGDKNEDGNDTDGDGVKDALEGGAWSVVFANNAIRFSDHQVNADLGFVYGNLTTNITTVCFRGGGMNPCTIDTDMDGIPDGWEMQHAGVPVQMPGRILVAPRGGKLRDVALDDETFIADGVFNGWTPTNTFVYIAGGMDATWGGDAAHDEVNDPEAGRSWDDLLGTVRDVDFDHDGLQNYQEYMIQSMRHFRYDDVTTPLMGRLLTEGGYHVSTGTLLSEHTQSFGKAAAVGGDGSGSGFPIFDPASPENTAANAAEAWYGRTFVYYETVTTGVKKVVKVINDITGESITNYTYYTAQKKRFKSGASIVADRVKSGGSGFQQPWTAAGWREAGYFAPPRHSWDRATASGKLLFPLYMYPITEGFMVASDVSVAGYATTDPRIADTDADGMDDYYEMFHGLNPILGTTPANANDTSWLVSKGGDIISAQFYMKNIEGAGELTLSRFNAWYNEWIYPTFSGVAGRRGQPPVGHDWISAPQAYDPVLYPWAMGSPMVDADGDGVRNDEERILANVADTVNRHTDPTPLWFTERTTPSSYVAQYYVMPEDLQYMPWGGLATTTFEAAALNAAADATHDLYNNLSYAFSFEENEGYDTDGDMTPDSIEFVKMVRSASDPLRFDDPTRRQALYLDGNNSFAMSRDLQLRPADSEDFLKQFTVECWFLPERTNADQTIVDRSVAYEGDSINTDKIAIRSNFRIGLTKQGHVYGMFDNNDSIESGLDEPKSCQFVDGGQVNTNEWTHAALTFDGTTLVLYVNGMKSDSAATTLIPANGVVQILQNPTATNSFTAAQYSCAPSAFFVGARPRRENYIALYPYYIDPMTGAHLESFDNLQDYFQGYVDEVRVWDGARTGNQILENYKKSIGYAEAKENRNDVFQAWYNNGGTRNNNDGKPNLPAELVLNFDFSTLPGAVDPFDVATVPAGFYANVLSAASSDYATNPDIDITGLYNIKDLKGSTRNPDGTGDGRIEGDLLVGWWNESELRSTVYDDYHVVPWIKNTVSHLPFVDGASPDSFVYSDNFGAVYTPATDLGIASFVFPNTADPYSSVVFNQDRYYRVAHARIRRQQLGENYATDYALTRFQVRNGFTASADLIPLGGAYAKTCPKLWDGGVADPWEQTQVDTNGDSIPDWWEEYARNNYSPDIDPSASIGWETIVKMTFGGNVVELPAGKAYVIDLYRGMQPGGNIDPAYASNVDVDTNNIPDWWENLFGVAGHDEDYDSDGDGLSNYAEYLFSFGDDPYGIKNGYPLLDPANQRTGSGQKVTDYYLAAPAEGYPPLGGAVTNVFANMYLGAIATDHDFMEDWWENLYSRSYANPRQYDPFLDRDGDGWSNWAEVRTYCWQGGFNAQYVDSYLDSNDDSHQDNHPAPAIGITPTYYGSQDVSGHSLVVRTYSGVSPRMDAKFLATGSNSAGTTGNNLEQTLSIGAYVGDVTIHGFLHPGRIVPGSMNHFYIRRADAEVTFYWHCEGCPFHGTPVGRDPPLNYEYWEYGEWLGNDDFSGTQSQYYAHKAAHTKVTLQRTDIDIDEIATTSSTDDAQFGKILSSGKASIQGKQVGTINYATGEYALDLEKVIASGVDLEDMMFVARYYYRIGDEWPQTLWMSHPEEGFVKEGLNTIEAFFDLDNNGTYTVGEPYGVVKGVDVGWHKTQEIVIELKDTSSVLPRINLADGSSDRAVIEGASAGVAMGGGEGSGATKTIRIVRDAINGEESRTRQVMAHTYVLNDRPYITEADVLSESVGRFDLDWRYLASDARTMGLVPMSADYSIVETLSLPGGGTTNTVLGAFTKTFKVVRPIATPVAPVQSEEVYTAAPTLSFTCDDETATAFRIQIADNTGSNIVYDSGVKVLGGRSAEGVGEFVCRFTPPAYADAPVVTNGAPLFADGAEYKWRVALFNAAFPASPDFFNEALDSVDWSAWVDFTMDVGNERINPSIPTGYGKVGAVVRYYGTLTNEVILASNVVIEAHVAADFRSQPLSQARLAYVDDIDSRDDISTTNSVLKGIAPGTVYLMAYIDINNNGRRDEWESWGYVNFVGTTHDDIYTPKGVTVVDSITELPTAVIYIEDCDINRNEIPDCLEPESFLTLVVAADDSDRDGLDSAEEADIGTDPGVWDTDSDGMPDGWEYLHSDNVLDPLEQDADLVGDDDDVMAYAEVKACLVTVKNEADPLDNGTVYAILDTSVPVPQVGDKMAGRTLVATYAYGSKTGVGSEVTIPAGDWRVSAVDQGAEVVLVHAQVYDRFGFSSRTCVAGDDAVNTKKMTALDKYLVVRYLEAIGFEPTAAEKAASPVKWADCYGLEDWVNVNRKWIDYTLKAKNKDVDRDGVNDGWELYVMFGPAGAGSKTNLTATTIAPWNYADARKDSPSAESGSFRVLDEFDGGNWPTDPWVYDTDGDGVFDNYVYRYHLKGDQAGEDPDGDGLSNYAEYLVSEVFQIVKLDPNKAMTDDSTLDYYRKFGELYLGEVFTDHDRVADAWEAQYEKGNINGVDYAARGIYDPEKDLDGDGWSNYAEYRAGTSPALQMSTGIDNYTLTEHPVPVVEMEIIYNGTADIEGRALTVKAWNEQRDPDALTAPDATWTVTTANESSTAGDNADEKAGEKEKYIGRMPTGKRTYYLGGGAIKEGSFKICLKDKNYVEGRAVSIGGLNYFEATSLGDPDAAMWFYDVIDQDGKLTTRGGIFAEAHVVGSIDYDTGRITIDFDDEEFTDELFVGDPEKDAVDSNSDNNKGQNTTKTYHGLHPADSYVKFVWSPVSVVPVRGVHFLGETDGGFLREGPTTFIVEAGSSGSGTVGGQDATHGAQSLSVNTSAGLYGVVRHVDVGWAGAKVTVELTDYNPITPRIDLVLGTVDRVDSAPFADYRIRAESNRLEAASGIAESYPTRVRVVRYSINGYPIVPTWGKGLADVVYDKTWYNPNRKFCELDFLLDGGFDIDWTDSFTAKVATLDGITRGSSGAAGTAGNLAQVIGSGTSITNIEYLVVIGDGPAVWERGEDTNTVVTARVDRIVRRFDRNRAKPVAVAVDGVQYSARPTFKWRMEGEESFVSRYGSSYTAFRLKVNRGSNVVYDSGILRAPEVDADGNFTWTAPICAGSMMENGQSFDTVDGYSWQVIMYNAKFRSDASDFWSDSSIFSTAVNAQQEVNDHGYSSIAVAVKYAGPSIVLGKYVDLTTSQGKVIVQAFSAPDFTGDPLAQGIATSGVDALAIAEANAWLKGLSAIGTYYIRAFVDMDGDGKLSDWEPWGYAADEVTLVNDGTMVKAPLVSIWIEDSDSDGDWIPDAYEYAAKGWTTSWDTLKGNTKKQPGGVTSVLPNGGIVLKLPVTDAGISKGLPGASLTTMQSPNFVAAVMGIETGTYQTTLDAIAEATRGKLAPKSVRVVAFSLAQDGSTVNLTVGADVASGIAGTIVERYYQFAGSNTVNVNVKILKKNALSDAEWTEVYKTSTPVSISAETYETIPVQIESQDLSSGFFKLELEEVP